MTVTVSELATPFLFDANLTDEEKELVEFDLYLNGQRGNQTLSYVEFYEFLDMCGIAKDSLDAAQAEIGVELELPEGTARLVRVSPSDDYVRSCLPQAVASTPTES